MRGVQGVSILAFLNPIILTAFSAAFLLVYFQNVERRSALWFAASYATCAMGFWIDFLRDTFPPLAISLSTNTLFMLTVFLTIKGLATRFQCKTPLLTIILAAALGYGVIFWFFFVTPSIEYRTIGINMAMGLEAMAGLAVFRKAQLKGFDQLLRAIFGIICLQFFLRTFLVFWLVKTPITQQHYLSSTYAVTLQFTIAIVSLAFAAALLAAVVYDQMRELKSESACDKLSGVLNRRGFDEAAEALLAGAGGAGLIGTLAIADIDHFKRVNDSRGHACGDVVIAAFGALLQTMFGQRAIVGRIGGEEFAILFPQTSLGDALRYCEKARQAFATLQLPGELHNDRITASFGLSGIERGATLNAVLNKADNALYAAKRAGRNRVVAYGQTSRQGDMLDRAAVGIATLSAA